MTGGPTKSSPSTDGHLDPGAYVGNEPELEAETIPGGVRPDDERVAAYGSRSGVDGEPDAQDDGQAGAVPGPNGSLSVEDQNETSIKTDMSAVGDDGQVFGG